MISKRLYLMCFFLFAFKLGFAQQSSMQVKGIVRDGETGKAIPSVTATIYIGKDSTVIKYGFTNNLGLLKFDNLPSDTTLMIVISHLSYQPVSKIIRFSKDNISIDLGIIQMHEKKNNLDEVSIISTPPVYMRGDTLVINPSAFQTKQNAVVEDVLRKVPGIVVWADGKISVNGKYVSELLVGGKPFFGGDPAVAIRNLPKQAIENIKVFEKKSKGEETDDNRTLTMDITLKNGIDAGYFGKTGAGKGTDERYDGNATISAFTPKDQITLVAVTNNLNKEIYDIKSMLRQSVYKPGGSDNGVYQSNFSLKGLNKFKAVGFNFDRDWSKQLNSRSEYFNFTNQNNTSSLIDQTTALENDVLNLNRNETSENSRHIQYGKSWIKSINKKSEFRLDPSYELQNVTNHQTTEILTRNDNLPVSRSSYLQDKTSDIRKWNLNTEYIGLGNIDENITLYVFRYKLNSSRSNSDELLNTSFSSLLSSSQIPEQVINRNKNAVYDMTTQSLYGELNLNKVLKFHSGFNYTLTNIVENSRENSSQNVNKINPVTGTYTIIDNYLTNTSNYNVLTEKPGLRIIRSMIIRGIRNHKIISASAIAESQYAKQDNESSHIFQNINRTSLTALPSAIFRFNHVKDNQFDRNYILEYKTKTTLPEITQLAPLSDSAYLYLIRSGNLGLKAQYNHEIAFNFQEFKAGQRGNLRFELKIGKTLNKFVDSSIYNTVGQRTSYTVNADGYKYFAANLSFEKGGKLFKNPYGLKLFPSIEFSNNPYYLNGKLINSKNTSMSLLTIINYVQNDLLVYNFSSNMFAYRNLVGNQRINSFYANTGGDVQLSWPRRVTLVNSLMYNVSSNSYTKKIENLIWNASVYFRMLKGEQLELRLAATDLLRQRTNAINYIENNMIGNGTANNLQHFFLVGLSYFPRQFGTSKKKN